MNDDLMELADNYFKDVHGVSFKGLLVPIFEQSPTGDPLGGAVFYQRVGEARQQDDSTLTVGRLAHELKHADWPVVAKTAAQAIAERSKDLQLAAWLLEAEIHRHGFAGVAPCLLLIEALLDKYWDDLYPKLKDGDLEHRANILRWIDEGLLPALGGLPITATGCGWREFTWADWASANGKEHLSWVECDDAAMEGVSETDVLSAMASTPDETHGQTFAELRAAAQATTSLNECLSRHFGEKAPRLTSLASLFSDISAMLEVELGKRGIKNRH